MEEEQLLRNLLNDLFEYREGHLVRKKSVSGRRSLIGDIAGSPVSGGYLSVSVNQKKYGFHKNHGRQPVDNIDIAENRLKRTA